MFNVQLALAVLVSFQSQRVKTASPKKTLTIGGLYASGAKTTFQNASGVIKAVEMALREINSGSNILVDYELKVKWQDTKVHSFLYIVRIFFEAEKQPKFKICKSHLSTADTRFGMFISI